MKETSNPFESPAELRSQAEGPERETESEKEEPQAAAPEETGFGLGSLAWIFPLAAWVPLLGIVLLATPGLHNVVFLFGILLCFGGGVLFTLFNIIVSKSNPTARRNALYGLTFNGLLIFLVIVACAGIGASR
ncbi:hypothetical protein DTL21_11440 [Bremerella cremea]|uniref:Uncharacterized protein n=1 Tax=Blastopirellula marina TaxID=124 RepID=A0A2S8FPP9_9BACT|nr:MULTISPECIES: hypothetical protein [Pirellulaceae]PQO34147.1 hypothetical protein C5Y83_11435 [Blastopirellula marina]RCS46644.1 hypothetical protein DTL21_11440 [Bremerella cremea]